MIKRLRVTVDGKSFDVTVDLSEETSSAGVTAPPPSPVPPRPATVEGSPAPPLPLMAGPAASVAVDVPSPLSGRVIAIVVKTDQDVKEGDHLVTLEAMKMNTFVFAPKSGKVMIKTEEGAVVVEGQALASIT